MFERDDQDLRKEIGAFKKHHNSYYTFELINGKSIIFERINSRVLKEFQLKTDKYIDVLFCLTYSDVYDDFESDDFLTHKLESLELFHSVIVF